jgi:hypothetical protein
MSRRDLLVSAGVAAVCAAILVLFTDVEVDGWRRLTCVGSGVNGTEGGSECR